MWKSRAICLATIFALGVKLRARQNSEKTTHVSSPLSSWTCRLRPQLPTRPVEKQGHRPHSLTSPTSTRLAGRRSVEATHRARGGAGPETPRTREKSVNPTRLTQYHFTHRTVISADSQCEVADRVTSRKFESARKLRRLPRKLRKKTKTKLTHPYTGYAPSYLEQCYHLGA